MRDVTVATLKLLGGHPALDFTNTIDSRGAVPGPDVLQSYGDLLDWALRVGVLDDNEAGALRAATPARAAAALARAKALREALYRILSKHPVIRPADLGLLQREAAAALAGRVLVAGRGGVGWH